MQKGLKKYARSTFTSLGIRNYRLYFTGQGISQAGTWVQTIAQTWLIYQLTGSGTYTGLLTAVQFLPILLLGPVGGLVTDRLPKRPVLYITQAGFMVLSVIMAGLVLSHTIQPWMVFVVAAVSGIIKVIDNPTRQTFIMEMVGREHITNAVTLNSIEVNMARVVGPAIGGALIAGIGTGWCFAVDAVSYLAVLCCLLLMRGHELHAGERVVKARGQLREGFQYVWHTPVLRNVLLMMVIIGTLSYEFQVVLPIFASRTFHAGAGGYSFLMGAMGLGAVIGGIITANRRNVTPRTIAIAALSFGVAMLLAAAAPHIIVAGLFMVLVGIGSISFTSVANSTLQLQSAPNMRGRVMSLWTMAFLGTTPIGGPIVGYVSEHTSARVGLLLGGLAAVAASALSVSIARRARQPRNKQPVIGLTEEQSAA